MNTFLHAEWRKLVLANYPVERKLLEKYIPRRTELDLWNKTCYVSLVGFLFCNTKLKGLKIPFHGNFEEVNLRFYVRSKENGKWKRGVVFIKEIVPKPAISFIANTVYKENYETMRMSHSWITAADTLTVQYRWKKNRWNTIKVISERKAKLIRSGSEEEFITEHYWGYTKISSEKTSEYKVEHPAWVVYMIKDYLIEVDFGDVYGPDFKFLTSEKPASVFLAEGSAVQVKNGRRI